MKRFLFALLSLLAFVPMYADEKPIDWDPENKNKNGERTIIPNVIASHDNSVLYLTTDTTLWGMEIEVTGSTCGVVYSYTTDIASGQRTSYDMGLGAGTYTIRVTIGDCEYTGSFTID